MIEDFPAAHSQDTQWYAVDQHGHVAVFDSGENGHVPEAAGDDSLLYELWEFQHPGMPERPYRRREDLVSHFGIFYFDYGEDYDPIAPYDRMVAPAKPLHVDQLPPQFRKRCKQIRFESLDFSRSEHLQPLEFFACRFWYTDRVAYLCGDRKRVRPIPGQEDQFVEFCRQLHAEQPDLARDLLFEFRYGSGVAWLCDEGRVVRPFSGQAAGFEAFCQEVFKRPPPATWTRDVRFEMSESKVDPASSPSREQGDSRED